MEEKELYTVKEVARYYTVATKTVRRWIKEGRIPAFKPGGNPCGWRIKSEDFDDFRRTTQ